MTRQSLRTPPGPMPDGGIDSPRRARGAWWRRWAWCGVLVLVASSAWWWGLRERDEAVPEVVEPVTAAVERTTLVSELRLSAQLTYGEPVPLATAEGTITVLPAPGQVVAMGERVYEADGRPVVLLRGERPFWRTLTLPADPQAQEPEATESQPLDGGETPQEAPTERAEQVPLLSGEDVRQLQVNLAELGFEPGPADGVFGARTSAAVRAWQRSLGLEPTGVFAVTDAVVVDAPGIRVSQVTALLGEAGVSPATYTATTLHAAARLTEAQAQQLEPGTPVVVVLPDGAEVEAALTAVDPGGDVGEDGQTSAPSATVEIQDQDLVAQVGPVAVRIVVHDDVEQSRTLVVPATAVLATAGGGYAVEVLREGEIVRLAVEIGEVADARVQILRSGSEVAGESNAPLVEGEPVVLAS